VIDVCKKVQKKLQVYRAHFSALTNEEIENAIQTITAPNKNLADAVYVRQEIDLRIGASLTRFQTINFRDVLNVHGQGSVLSYGPCQFPTLGFIVERFQQIRDFRPEKFWQILLLWKRA